MLIALLGSPWSDARKKALAAAGFRVVTAERAALRLVAAVRPPAKPPRAPWLWCPAKPVGAAETMAAVMAGAYDVVPLDGECAAIVKRRLEELAVRVEAGTPPEGYVARSTAAQRVLAELGR